MLDQGRPRDAVARLRVLLPRFGAYPDLHAALGRVQIAAGHPDDAIVSLARALSLQPQYHAARVLLASALECVGDIAQAQEQIALVLHHDPSHAEALERRQEWVRRGERMPPRARSAR